MSRTLRLALLSFLAALVVAGMALLVERSHSHPNPAAPAPVASPAAVVHRQDEAKALLFWNGDPSLAQTRAYVGAHHETVHYLESVTAPKDAPPSMVEGMAVYDPFAAEWHLFHITAPASPAPNASPSAPAAAPTPVAAPVIPAAASRPSPAPAPVAAPAAPAPQKAAQTPSSRPAQSASPVPGLKNMAGGPAYTVVQDAAGAAAFWASSGMAYTRSQTTAHVYLGSVPDRTGALKIDSPSPLLPGNLHVWDGARGEWHLYSVR